MRSIYSSIPWLLYIGVSSELGRAGEHEVNLTVPSVSERCTLKGEDS
jgi:hypothetical protein